MTATGGGHRLAPTILREYDIRGRVGEGLDEADAHAVGRGFATVVRRAGGRRVAVGRDGRLSSPRLEAALVRGLAAGGADVVRIGLGPSPMLYFAERHLGVDGGIQVTASHNPGQDNGFKLVHQRRPFFGEAIQQLAALCAEGDWEAGAGNVSEADIADAYVARLIAGYTGGVFRIGWDCGSGAMGPVVEKLTQLLPGEHHLLHTEVDGHFPHHHPDPTVEANLADLRALVAAERLDFGFAFDGDGDRIGAVDAGGRVLWGDTLLAILAEDALLSHPGATIVADVKSSATLFDRIRALGGVPIMARTGHSSIKTRMREVDAPIAGELSGHLFFAELGGHDDAGFAAVRLVSALHAHRRSLAEWRDLLPGTVVTPDIRVPVPPHRRHAVVAEVVARLEAAGTSAERTDGVRVAADRGWWLLRASNTEAALTVRAEAPDETALARMLDMVRAHLAASGVRLD